MYDIKEMPLDQRPRERLMLQGAHALLNEELMAILLRTGHKHQNVLELSKHVLHHLKDMDGLRAVSYHELLRIPGIKDAKATTILAAIELGKRLSNQAKTIKYYIKKPVDVYHKLYKDLKDLKQEHFMVIYLNIKSQIIDYDTVFIGTISQLVIHPREIFKHAIKLSASAVICVHNHPSGDSTPSTADAKATDQLSDAGCILGIDVIDHIIIGHQEFYSFKEKSKTYL